MQYGTLALQALCLRGGQASQDEIAQDIGLATDRLSPILAGLHHNGYLVRHFQMGSSQVTLTEEGQRWAKARNIAVPAPRQPQAAPPPQPAPPPAAAPARQPPPRMTQQPAVAPPVTKPPIAEPPAAAPPTAAPATAEPEQPAAGEVAEPAPVKRGRGRPRKTPAPTEDTAPAAEGGEAEPRKRGRPRRKPADEAAAVDDTVTDESGFVTHIKGKRIF